MIASPDVSGALAEPVLDLEAVATEVPDLDVGLRAAVGDSPVSRRVPGP